MRSLKTYKCLTAIAILFIAWFSNVSLLYLHQPNVYSNCKELPGKSGATELKSVCAICSLAFVAQDDDAAFGAICIPCIQLPDFPIESVDLCYIELSGSNNKSPPFL